MKNKKNVIAPARRIGGSTRSNLSNRLPRRDYSPRNDKRGFTLIEILLSLTIMSTLALAVFGLQDLFRQNEQTAFNSFSNVTEANNIMRQFSREIRRATASENGSFPLETLDDNEIIFYTDTNLNNTAERVRYTRINNTLTKGVIAPTGTPAVYLVINEVTKILSESIQNNTLAMFEYYNSSWPTDVANNPLILASRLSDTKQVRIFILLNNNINFPEQEYALDSFIKVRNL